MQVDVIKLQKIVDKMSKPSKSGWVLDHDYAKAFFDLISPYVKKAAYKSEYNPHGDPEDAFAETRWEVWRALEKYGPRPKGNLFGDYTLKLKTNNILTNREKKRSSQKSCLNFVSESLDGLEALALEGERYHTPPSCAPFDLCLFKEELIERSKKENNKVTKIMKRINKLDHKEKLEVFYSTASAITGKAYDDCIEQFINLQINLNFLSKLKPPLYNDPVDDHILAMEEMMANKLADVKVGDKFITKAGGKIIEIRSKTRKGFKILVVLTGKEIAVDDDYIKNSVEPYEDEGDPVEQTFEEPVEKAVVEEPVEKVVEEEVVEPPKKKRGRKPVIKNSKKPKPNKGEKKMAKTKTTRKETKKALILELLKQGPQTRDSLANAIIAKGLSKHNDVTKEKSYASVILFNLKKEGAPVTRLERGKYVLEGVEPCPCDESCCDESCTEPCSTTEEAPAETTEEAPAETTEE